MRQCVVIGFLFSLLLSGCGREGESGFAGSATVQKISIPDSQTWQLSGHPQQIIYGVGSGWDGIDVYQVTSGTATVALNDRGDFSTYHRLSAADLYPRICALLVRNEIATQPREFSGDTADGTQAILVVIDGEHTKAIYFDNDFPSWLQEIHTLLTESGRGAALARPPRGQLRQEDVWKFIQVTGPKRAIARESAAGAAR